MGRKIYTDEKITEAVKVSSSFTEVIAFLGAKQGGNSYQRIRQKIDQLGLDRSHFKEWTPQNGGQNKKDWTEVLVSGKTRRESGKRLRRCLIESGSVYACLVCGLSPEWQGKPLTLQVDHIDGNWTNCVRDNLRFLCPNCHTQTPTYGNQTSAYKCIDCGKKITKGYSRCLRCAGIENTKHQHRTTRPKLEVLLVEVQESGYKAVGRKYKVSDNTIRSWIKIEQFKQNTWNVSNQS